MNKVSLKEDFYAAVNETWLEQAEIPADKPATSAFQELSDDIEKLLIADTKKLSANAQQLSNDALKEYLAYYRLASDFQQRDADGAAPLLPFLQRIEAVQTIADLNQQLTDWTLSGLPLPFHLSVDTDMKNTTINALFASAPPLILPDKTYYTDEELHGEELVQVFKNMVMILFSLVGRDEKEAQKITDEALAFDRLLAPHVKSAEESADYAKMYNPKSGETFVGYSNFFDLKQLLHGLIGTLPETVVVTEPAFFEALDKIANEETFPFLKSWMIVQLLASSAHYLSEDFRQIGGLYGRALSGADEEQPQEKAAFYLASSQFDQVVGDYYGKKYFGAQAKADVERMVRAMIGVYQQRLTQNSWLSEATRKKAVLKLQTLSVHVGYPEKIPAIYSTFKVTDGSLLENAFAFQRLELADAFKKWNKEVDREEWEMSAATVNAYYHPFRNSIVFPAAILQEPFYSLQQSDSANFGGIGAVIAHEISHAFDNNGALFDEYGNLNNWWTEADQQHFHALAEQMIAAFDGVETEAGKVNGKLTVSENIADAGGLSCALEAAKQRPQADMTAFFVQWATVWRMKARPEYMQLLLSVDVHAPSRLRTNLQVKNLADFHETFGITAEDKMYLAPEKRVSIW